MASNLAIALLCRFLREPEAGAIRAEGEGEGETLIRVARQTKLLGNLAHRLAALPEYGEVPVQTRLHLESASRQAEYLAGEIRWIMYSLDQILMPDIPVLLLKGGAYVAGAIPHLRGRLPGDVDIMVPRSRLVEVQQALEAAGWSSPPLNAYDLKYYHEWSHELPPMTNPEMAMELDVHWHIVPPVGKPTFPADSLWARSSECAGGRRWRVLHPEDQVIHACLHLLQHTELTNRLRDVFDIHCLVGHFSTTPNSQFIDCVLRRAAELGAGRPTYYGLWLADHWFGIPVHARESLRAVAPAWPLRKVMEAVLNSAIQPAPLDTDMPPLQALSAWLLLCRHHIQRMPPRLLARHAAHKAAARMRT